MRRISINNYIDLIRGQRGVFTPFYKPTTLDGLIDYIDEVNTLNKESSFHIEYIELGEEVKLDSKNYYIIKNKFKTYYVTYLDYHFKTMGVNNDNR